jgi:hypothetical protein
MSEPALHRWTTSAWILIGGAVCSWMIPLEPNLLEEGIALHLAQRMLQGEHLFRDLASFTGPLPFELLALLFRAFGDDIFVARGAVALMQGVACGALYALVRAARRDELAHLAAAFFAAAPVLLFPLFSLYFYSLIALQLALAAAWAAASADTSPRFALACGALVACVALCKQNFGVALAAAFAVTLVALTPRGRRLEHLAAYTAGGGAVAVATVALYALRGDLVPLWQSLVTLPLSFTATFDSPYVNLWPPGELRGDVYVDRARYVPRLYGLRFSVFEGLSFATALWTQLLYAAPFIALGLTAWVGRAGSLPRATWIHTALLVATVPTLFPRTDWGHLVYVLPAAVVQLCLLSRAPGPRWRRGGVVALVLGLSAASASAGAWLHHRARPARFGPHLPIAPVSDMLAEPALGQLIAMLRTRTSPGEPIFVARAEPLIYFASGNPNPTPYSGVIPGILEEQERTISKALRFVRYVVMSDIDQPLFVYYSDVLPGVWAQLERHYEVARGSPPGWLTLLERGSDRGPTAIDLFDRRTQGRPFVRGGDGSLAKPAAPAPRLAARLNHRPLAFWVGERGGGIDFEVTVPADATFRSGVALWRTIGLTAAYEHPRDVDVVVSLAGEDGVRVELARRRVLEGRSQSHGWLPLEADLAAWAGQRVTLRLELRADRTIEPGQLAWFGSPRLTTSPTR